MSEFPRIERMTWTQDSANQVECRVVGLTQRQALELQAEIRLTVEVMRRSGFPPPPPGKQPTDTEVPR